MRSRVVAAFDGGHNGGQVTSDARATADCTDRAIGLIDRLAACFLDRCSQADIEHSVRTLVAAAGIGERRRLRRPQ
jgi:hypothetical protein